MKKYIPSGRVFRFAILFIWACVALVCFTSCRTIKQNENTLDERHVVTMLERMDSVMHKTNTVIQDTTWRETFVKELQSIKERNDTSHTLVVDTAGNVIKETTIIYKEREVISEKEQKERELLIHKIEKMDSTMAIMQKQVARSDSILHEKTKEKVVEKKVIPKWCYYSLALCIIFIIFAIIKVYKKVISH